MKSLLALPACVALLAVPPAAAEDIDLDRMACADFILSDASTMTVIVSWLDGFHSDVEAEPVIDTDRLARNANRLVRVCAASPDTHVATAAEELFGH